MASVKLLLYTHKTLKDGSHPIVLSLIKDRKRKIISIGYSAKENEWSSVKLAVNSKYSDFKKVNRLLKRKISEAEAVILDLDTQGDPYIVDDIVDALQESKKPSTFKGYADHLIENLKRAGKNGNARVYSDAASAFFAFYKKPDIDFKNLNIRLLEQFRQALLEKGTKINTISVYLRTLRAIFNKAIKDNLVSEKFYPFKHFKIKTEPTIKRALTKNDIINIRDLDLKDNKRLELARDIFLFSFYNRGMNYIDICYLKNEDVEDGRIRYRRKKTGQTLSIKLTEQANKIITKYHKTEDTNAYVFPILKEGNEYSSYRTGIRILNKRLKTIGTEAKVKAPLSSYVARHSWATIAKRSGIPTSIISEGLAHNTEKTTQIYLDSFEDETLDKANDNIIGDL